MTKESQANKQPQKTRKASSHKKQQQQSQLTIIYGVMLAIGVVSACLYYSFGVRNLVFPENTPSIDGIVSDVHYSGLAGMQTVEEE